MKNLVICVDANVVVALLTEEKSPVHLRWQQWLDTPSKVEGVAVEGEVVQ